jgi:hypothetical protein
MIEALVQRMEVEKEKNDRKKRALQIKRPALLNQTLANLNSTAAFLGSTTSPQSGLGSTIDTNASIPGAQGDIGTKRATQLGMTSLPQDRELTWKIVKLPCSTEFILFCFFFV